MSQPAARHRNRFAKLVLLAAVAALTLSVDVAATAQDWLPPEDIGPQPQRRILKPAPPPPQRRGGFLEMLFGPRLLEPFRGRQQALPPQVQPLQPAEPPLPTVEISPKDPDAKKILVLGDFVAGGIAWGLDQTLAEEPKLAVVDRSNNSSGLVRADYYDWNAELLKILNEEKPAIIVMELGANDRQRLRLDGKVFQPGTDTWEATYEKRLAGLVDTLKVYGRPFFWVGAPPMRVDAASADMTHFNELFKAKVSDAGGYFVDIWNGFADEDGNYISSGPDVDGQLRALRSGDGINFTRAGRLKLAFFVDREIKRVTGVGAGGIDLLTSTNQTSHIEIGPDGKKRLVGPIISLSDPLPGASQQLAGAPDEQPPDKSDTPQYRLVVAGEAPATLPGRADDFAWPPGPRAAWVPGEAPVAATAPAAKPAKKPK